MQVDATKLMTEALMRQAVALGVLTEDGELTDPEAQARVERRPGEPVLVRGVPLREVLSLRSLSEEDLRANWETDQRASPVRERVVGRAHPDSPPAEGGEPGDDFAPSERWLWAQSIPQEEVDAAMRLASPPEVTGGVERSRDALLLALAARVERLEARILELEGGAE